MTAKTTEKSRLPQSSGNGSSGTPQPEKVPQGANTEHQDAIQALAGELQASQAEKVQLRIQLIQARRRIEELEAAAENSDEQPG